MRRGGPDLGSEIGRALNARELAARTHFVQPASISEDDASYLKSMSDEASLAKFDEYLESRIDVRQPDNKRWLNSIFPAYVDRLNAREVNPRNPGALKYLLENEPDYVQRRIAQLQQEQRTHFVPPARSESVLASSNPNTSAAMREAAEISRTVWHPVYTPPTHGLRTAPFLGNTVAANADEEFAAVLARRANPGSWTR